MALSIGFRSGVPTTTTCPFVVASLSASVITVSVSPADAAAIPVTPSAIGGVGYVGNDTFTGLSPLTQYSWTVTQDGNTETGTFYTAPEVGDDWWMAFGSCFRVTNFYGGDQAGGWNGVRNQVADSALPCVGVFFVDDYGYVDTAQVTGVSVGAPSTTKTVADYAVAWLCVYGLYDSSLGDWAKGSQRPDYIWCGKNLNLFPQWGDHEFDQDCGWDDSVGSATFSGQFASGKTCWDAFMGPLQGSTSGFSGTENHWYADLGDVRLFAPDGITSCAGGGGSPTYADGTETAIAAQFGDTQIDDLLTAASVDNAFKVFGMGRGIKYMEDTTLTARSRGNQMTIFDHTLVEYKRLFTRTDNGANPESLMENVKTNGKEGTTVLFHGDYHNAHVYLHNAPADTNIAQEAFYEIGIGTINGSTNAPISGIVNGDTSGDGYASVEYFPDNVSAGTQHWWTVFIEVYGSRLNKEMHVIMKDDTGAEVWGKKFVHQKYKNFAVDRNYEIRGISSGSADE